MTQTPDLGISLVMKTPPGDVNPSKAIQHFFDALSGYVSFLEQRSAVTESDRMSNDVNLFSPCPDVAEVSFIDAIPVVMFAEAVEALKGYEFDAFTAVPHTYDLETHIETLKDLWDMAADFYRNSRTLEIKDQQIILLQAILLLTPPSHPSRDDPCLMLGEALIARYSHTNEITDLDRAIVYYRESHLVQGDPYELLLELERCIWLRFHRTQCNDDLDETVDILRRMLSEMSPSHCFRFDCLEDLGSIMMFRHQKDNCTTYIEEAISCYREALELCRSKTDTNLAVRTIDSFSDALIVGDQAAAIKVNASDVVNVIQAFLSLNLDTESDKYNQLSDMLTTLLRTTRTSQGYSDDMMTVIRTFITLEPSSDTQNFARLDGFSMIQMTRFSASQNVEYLNEAISVYRGIAANPPPIEVYSPPVPYIGVLSGLLKLRFQYSPSDEDAQEIKALYRDLLASSTLNNQALIMQSFADFLVQHFKSNPQLEDREEALTLYNDALQIVSADEAEVSKRFDLLVAISQTLLLTKGAEDEMKEHFRIHVDEAIGHLKTAILLLGCDSQGKVTVAKRLLLDIYLARYQMTHALADFDASAKLMNDDEELNHAEFRDIAMQLGINKIRDEKELEELIDTMRQYLKDQPFPHPSRPGTLTSLGMALAQLSRLGGPERHLNEAILRLREAMSLSPKSTIVIGTLAEVLFDKFEVSTEEFMKDHCIDEFNDIVAQYCQLAPKTIREHIEDPNAIDYPAIRDHISRAHDLNEVLNVDHFEVSKRMASLYFKAFSLSEDIKDLDESIYYSREAALNCHDDHPRGAVIFRDLGISLLTRYWKLDNEEDLNETLECYRKSILILPPKSYHKSLYYRLYGMVMWLKLTLDLDLDPDDHQAKYEPLSFLRAGAMESSASPVPHRFQSATRWATMADTYGHESALEAYQQAIDLLPRVSSMAANLTSRQKAFRTQSIDGISRNAALYAIRVEKYDKAIEFLEAGRAVFWLQALQLRSPMEKLRNQHPDLHLKLSKISAELEKASLYKATSHARGTNTERQVQDEELFKLEGLNEDWQQTLEDIHEQEGFDDFLVPQRFPKLQASTDCPVIFLIPDYHQSHALIMLSETVLHVNLLNADAQKLQSLISKIPGVQPSISNSFMSPGANHNPYVEQLREQLKLSLVIETKHSSLPSNDQYRDALFANLYSGPSASTEYYTDDNRHGKPMKVNTLDPENGIRDVLEALWKDVVGPILQEMRKYTTGSLQKVCWCPTGMFSFLPLHAAGIYRDDMSSVECAFDYFISSYIPTIGALSHRIADDNHKHDAFKMMVVVDPNLPNTTNEMEAIKRHVDAECLLTMGTRESPALIEKVASSLKHISIAHFACHGKQNEQPLDSGLILHDGNLKISRMMEERMPNADLAFLCACETAMGDKEPPDEAMHIGASLLYSGFRGVVATMWAINDEDGPVVADEFYKHLFKDDSKKPDTSTAAEAVHYAITALRQRRIGFQRWVPFIYLGA